MEAEGNVRTPAKAEGKLKPRHLVAIIIIFLILIVGLVIWIVFNHMNGGEQKEVACEEMANSHDMMTCLSHEEPGDELNKRYDTALEKSFNEENYELFNELILDRVSNLVLDDNCETALEWVDSIENEYKTKLSILDLRGFYVSGLEAASECGNSEKEAYYQNQMNKIMNSKEYADAVAGDDYRIIGEDIMDEEIEDDGDEYEE